MFNFTGSTNRRNVNLGERRRSRGGSFLQQTHREQQKREELRLKERAAAVIQGYVRQFLALRQIGNGMVREWNEMAQADINWLRWCSMFAFIAKNADKEVVEELFPHFTAGIENLQNQLDGYSVAVLARAIRDAFQRHIDPVVLLRCLATLLDRYTLPKEYTKAVSGLSKSVTACMNPANYCDVVRLDFKINAVESPLEFPLFLASIPPEYVFSEPSMVHLAKECLSTSKAMTEIVKLSAEQKISLVANIVRILGASFVADDCRPLALILAQMEFTICFAENNKKALKHGDKQEFSAGGATAASLRLLGENPLVSKAIDQLLMRDPSPLLPHVMRVFPDLRLKLCMVCTIHSGLLRSVYDQLTSCPEYAALFQFELDSNIALSTGITISNDESFTNLLFFYCNLLSYWLTVTTDNESFDPSSFLAQAAENFTRFLKIEVLLLVLRLNLFPWTPSTISQQREISIMVLNQLYMKNLRVKFLPENFWIVKNLGLNTKTMIALLEAEQKRIEDEEDLLSDDEGGAKENAKPSLKFRKISPTKTAPVVEILKTLPFFVNFTERVEVFRGLVANEKERIQQNPEMPLFTHDPHFNNLSADIRREFLLEDAFDAFHNVGDKFKHQLRVTFFNEFGVEAGIDGGGITKEFLTALVMNAFDPENELALFKQTDQYNLYPNPDIYLKLIKSIDKQEQAKRLAYMRFMGMAIGKCLFEGILIEFRFAHFFLSKWRIAQSGTKSSVDDLAYLDGNLSRNLMKLMDMSSEQISTLDLNFEIDEKIDGDVYKFPLGTPTEAEQTVTAGNRLRYIHQVANFKLNQCIQVQTGQFLKGLFHLIKPNWLNMFDPFELQMLISGTSDINLQDWKEHVNYGGYWETDLTIRLFWEVVEEMSAEDQQALVRFVTSASRAPLLGFAALDPKFGISRVPDHTRLPTASTCANLLKLPQYQLKTELREKLLYSIHANSGFDLS